MSLGCSRTRERLLDGARDHELDEHLTACAECAAVARALAEVDDGLAHMMPIEPPDALVTAALAKVEGARAPEPAPEPIGARALLVAAVAAIVSAIGALLMAPLALVRWMVSQRAGRWTFGLGSATAALGAVSLAFLTAGRETALSPRRDAGVVVATTAPGASGASAAAVDELTRGAAPAGTTPTIAGLLDVEENAEIADQRVLDGLDGLPADADRWRDDTGGALATIATDGDLAIEQGQHDLQVSRAQPVERGPIGRTEGGDHDGRFARLEVEPEEIAEAEMDVRAGEYRVTLDRGERDTTTLLPREIGGEDLDSDLALAARVPPADRAPISRWWAEATELEGRALRARDGWWSTTYVPGDPAMRALHARLASTDSGRDALALAETATPVPPAIDAPTDRAIALGVQADVAAVEGPTRVRLEVDLRGIRQAAGRRAPMRIAVVIDARSALGDDEQARLRALLTSLGRAAGARDRIAVIVAGPRGGTLVPLGALRHGELEVALRRLFDAGGALAPLSPAAALVEAARTVASADDVGLVLLATPDAAHDAPIDDALHRAAVAGVPTSVVAIGDRARPEDLDAIAIEGQGRRRIVRASRDADAVARAEIEAASQLVARAMRIRVRLAPGVQLVDVVGSRPLDARETLRTREAERAIDRDLAQRLGIASDRDEDDDGIRIFVPAFYADDAHAVLLDLVVPGPGAVAEIDVRYKDLVRLENGQAAGALTLGRGAPSRGTREARVVAALLAHEVSVALAEAGDRVQHGDRAGAEMRLAEARAAIDEARRATPALARDRSTAALATLLDRHRAALVARDAATFADGARYASHRLIVRPRLAAAD